MPLRHSRPLCALAAAVLLAGGWLFPVWADPGMPPVRWSLDAAASARHAELPHPGDDVRADELRLSLESRLRPGATLRAEIEGARPEDDDPRLRLGELALALHPAGGDDRSALRLGRLAIPFGEESRSRRALDNPLVSRSLADPHGYDQGAGYVLRGGLADLEAAVQDGGPGGAPALAARAGLAPFWWLRISLSGYRSGWIEEGRSSPLRFEGERIRAAGGEDYRLDLVQADGRIQWESGQLGAALGRLRMGGEPGADAIRYGSVEASHTIFWGLYAAARYSRIEEGADARDRLSLGAGVRWHSDLVFKVEYTREELPADEGGRSESLASVQVAARF